jgi:hypothetical protein
MGTRKGYPFSSRAYNQGWGILSNTIIVLLCIVVYAIKWILSIATSKKGY